MQQERNALLALLKDECEKYTQIPSSENRAKQEQKKFIYGIMTASRVVGISYEELETIVNAMSTQPQFKDLDEKLAVPTYIRDKVQLEL
ncbi:hypothetical protein EJ063_15940 [Vibrio aquaticus]|uniref:Uncharacterized protein n=1 Tax=Vibrio aquaticus TaxID=2496559 RepID=A0A432CT88_9VIBR|nr:hypothetical protein [Vibrio aquaticus]RTZ14406.1 hypothetical protein EJ063_15940 [Vibrio aquaticus]